MYIFYLLHRSVLHDEHNEVRSRFIILQAVGSMHPWKTIGKSEKQEKCRKVKIFKSTLLSHIIVSGVH